MVPQSEQPVRTVDVHTHVISPELLDTLRRDGARYGVELVESDGKLLGRFTGGGATKPISAPLSQVDRRLPTMDHQGVDVQVLSTWIDLCGYRMPLAEAAAFSRLQNATIAELVQSAPHRFVGSANVPLQHPEAAVEVLREAVERLDFRGVQIGTVIGDRYLDDLAFEPFWDAAEALGVLVLVHPHEENPPPPLRAYHLSNIVGNPLQTTVALARLLFGGVLERHPRLTISFSHGGGLLPYQVGRVQRGFATRAETRAGGVSTDPLTLLRRCYFDTVLSHPSPISFLAGLVGPDRLLLGSDYPFEMGDPEPVQTVRAALSTDAQSQALGQNAAALLGLVSR